MSARRGFINRPKAGEDPGDFFVDLDERAQACGSSLDAVYKSMGLVFGDLITVDVALEAERLVIEMEAACSTRTAPSTQSS